ncbi:PREDICTED: LOW QUALITY PROTEIN: uncharacterized protein LOC105502129 [Colobus angolensis palliatus]|uniref:LOW QUALITY PROTEIN: uncharacterized protein LOC105502129 n=1 Tax=Colobus angolensis palliatus TaxID=336983 RepID=UPI0005F582D0|nr:PREDICTED: LOW QUALITY PROTEIN: uncharacterized protein LOC105502129 [Colobus angolensis palliatus]
MQTGLCVSPMNRAVPDVFLTGGAQVPRGHTRRCLSAVESRELEEEEAGEIKEGNGSHAVPLRRSGAFWAHGRNYDVFKRHSWGPGRELEDPLSRRTLQASGCPGPEEAPYLQNQEELDTFVGLHTRVATLPGCCSQLEGHSGTWAGSSLRQTFSFLLGMTGKAKSDGGLSNLVKGNEGRDFGAQMGNREAPEKSRAKRRVSGARGRPQALEGKWAVGPLKPILGPSYLSELPPHKPWRPVLRAGTPPSLRSASPLPELGRGRRLGFEELVLGAGRGESDFLSPRPTRAGRTPPPALPPQ